MATSDLHIDRKMDFVRTFQNRFESSLLEEMVSIGNFKSMKADARFIDIGDHIFQMPIVLSGSIKILTEDEEGNELLLYYLEPGDTCAVTLNCCTRKSKSTIKAFSETDVDILMIPVEKMEEWMGKYRSWRNFVLESYNSRLNEMVSALDNVVFNSLEERLIKYLRDRSWATKNAVLKISHHDIARELNSSRVVISRLMKKLEQSGLISQSRNKVVFLEFSDKT